VNVLALLLVAQLPVEIHHTPTIEGRMLLRAINSPLYVVDEDTRVMRHYQDELRKIAKPKLALDSFIQISQHRVQLDPIAFDNPYFTVMAIKREIDIWNMPRRKYDYESLDADTVRFAGLVDLGDEGKEVSLPLPWKHGYELTAWKPPTVEK
jgi:hypothetical protein